MDCKKALNTKLTATWERQLNSYVNKVLRKLLKKADRIAAEGLLSFETKRSTTAFILELNSETDFVAKNERFPTHLN